MTIWVDSVHCSMTTTQSGRGVIRGGWLVQMQVSRGRRHLSVVLYSPHPWFVAFTILSGRVVLVQVQMISDVLSNPVTEIFSSWRGAGAGVYDFRCFCNPAVAEICSSWTGPVGLLHKQSCLAELHCEMAPCIIIFCIIGNTHSIIWAILVQVSIFCIIRNTRSIISARWFRYLFFA